MSSEEVEKYFQVLETELVSEKNWQYIRLTREWTKQFPTAAGVYAIRENGQLAYVGETGSIRARMNDLLNTQNHVIRRTIGNLKYKDLEGFAKATSYKKFLPEIEEKLNEWIQNKLEVNVLVVRLGRKEFEEHIYYKHKPKYNNKGKRESK